jgi:hypothetical protein
VRSLLTTIMIVAIAMPAYAQLTPNMSSGESKISPNIMGDSIHLKTDEEVKQERERENAYKSGISKIPDQKGKLDPWGNVRGAATPQPDQKQRPASK